MKLRNKKTGEIVDLIGSERSCPYITIGIDFHDGKPRAFDYTSLTELNEEWEDYAPAEPLIKDEKIRNIIRVWAEANQSKFLMSNGNYTAIDNRGLMIEFKNSWSNYMKNGKKYTITELCGEEKE